LDRISQLRSDPELKGDPEKLLDAIRQIKEEQRAKFSAWLTARIDSHLKP
jgi:hypothetical protein